MVAAMKRLVSLRGKWRDQVFADSRIKHGHFRVAYSLSNFMTMDWTAREYRKTGKIYVFPSQETLAHDAHASLDTVHKAIKQLTERGHLKMVSRGNQFANQANVYRILVKPEAAHADRVREQN
jgi:DNA-binding transcriptional MocR family regulator